MPAAEALIECIQGFAVEASNPVLSVLPLDRPLEYHHKYPEPVFDFSSAGLKAYYHCHPSVSCPAQEHGHFHIFVSLGPQQWSHIAGLSMDRQGQPLQWFTVNHWVTGEAWAAPHDIVTAVERLSEPEELSLTEKWLWHMVQFYLPTLRALLDARERRFEALSQQRNSEEVQQDHEIYLLSARDIDLLQDLERQIAALA
ncbi:DUF6969 family protein [Sulfuriflexus mobilis]|uniref:DUF6969 family protein n=1 Tax=Sulfuriflexus mobilis TaxID=1811807 RepID=UPI000F83AA1C|nr:hypothetical protein [Sulfuriflexus mobilis]